MRVLCVLGRYNYGNRSRGTGYEFANFVPALIRLGHNVAMFDNTDRSLYDGFPALNAALLSTVEQFQPDVILAIQSLYEIWTETWDLVRRTGRIRIVNWATDDSWKYRQSSRFLAPHFDNIATTYADKKNAYVRDGYTSVVLSQWAANAVTLQPPISSTKCKYPVSFIGSCYGRRRSFISFLRNNGIDVHCFGHGWPGGAIDSKAISEIIRCSVVSLNFSGSGMMLEKWRPMMRQVKARMFEIPGMGGFLLTEWAPFLDLFYDSETEIDTFHNEKQLLERIRFYLANPELRDRMALAAYQRTCREHTYDLRMRALLDSVVAGVRKPDQQLAEIDWNSFRRVAGAHRMTPALHFLRTILVAIGSLMFGAERGPRAARRLLFELSWRVSGRATYSSRGLPGRLFYFES